MNPWIGSRRYVQLMSGAEQVARPLDPIERGLQAHPLYQMWKDRLDTELIREQARADRRAVRARELAAWHEAWRAYKARSAAEYVPLPKPRWWNLLGWARWILRLHAPGRPN